MMISKRILGDLKKNFLSLGCHSLLHRRNYYIILEADLKAILMLMKSAIFNCFLKGNNVSRVPELEYNT